MIQNSISDNRIVWLDVIRLRCNDNGHRRSLHRSFLHFTHDAGNPRIHALGSNLRFTPPPVGSLVCYDDRATSAPCEKTAIRSVLQKTHISCFVSLPHLVSVI